METIYKNFNIEIFTGGYLIKRNYEIIHSFSNEGYTGDELLEHAEYFVDQYLTGHTNSGRRANQFSKPPQLKSTEAGGFFNQNIHKYNKNKISSVTFLFITNEGISEGVAKIIGLKHNYRDFEICYN